MWSLNSYVHKGHFKGSLKVQNWNCLVVREILFTSDLITNLNIMKNLFGILVNK